MTSYNKKTVEDINVKGKRVLVRCDFNVPMKDGKITNDNRIVAALPTLKKLIENGGSPSQRAAFLFGLAAVSAAQAPRGAGLPSRTAM